MVRYEIRRQGWREHLDLRFEKRQYTVRVHSDNWLQVRLCMHVCARARVCVYVTLCVCVCVCDWLHANMLHL